MNFLHVNFLLGWLIIPLIIGFYIYSYRKKRRLLSQFANTGLWTHLISPVNLLNQRIKVVLLLLGIIFGVIALAQPRWGFQWQEVQRRGVDIIIALDVSRSMLAEDVKPDRLTRAKREIIDLLRLIEGDRVGLVAFAGTSFLQSPLTLDYGAIEIFLDALDTELIPVPGTAINHALKTAIYAFSDTPHDARAVILITDGEDHSGQLADIMTDAQKEGIKLFIIGIGESEGAPVPAPDGGFLRNAQGELVLSKLKESDLKKLAVATNGSYVQSITGDLDLEKIYYQDIKGTTESQDFQSARRRLWNEQFQWFVFAVVLCWGIEPLLSQRSSRHQLDT